MYLSRESYNLHSLALIGVRSVLGIDSPRGSPFNVQRSLQIPNLTRDEVVDMFQQYQSESGQVIEPNVVDSLFDATRGQPGLVGWFGELLTEKYNPGIDKRIDTTTWENVYSTAIYVEWNNSLLNLGKKAREPYRAEVMRLFTDPNVSFTIEQDWCSYLYMNGIIDSAPAPPGQSSLGRVCRFSSPFIQTRLYWNLSQTMELGREQAARYAQKLGLTSSTLVVFAPTNDDTVLEKLANDRVVNGIRVITIPFGWV